MMISEYSAIMAPNQPERLLKLRHVLELTALSRATLYRRMEQGTFPRPVKFGRASRWVASEIAGHIEACRRARSSDPA
jgi:prophage regulatory protein